MQIRDLYSFFVAPQEEAAGKKIYRELSSEEKKALKVLLQHLSEDSMFWLATQPQEIRECRDILEKTHPLMFIAASFETGENRILLKKVYDRGSLFWKPYVNGIFDEAKLQEREFQNITPHINDFSRRIGLESEKVGEYFINNNLSEIFHSLFSKYKKNLEF